MRKYSGLLAFAALLLAVLLLASCHGSGSRALIGIATPGTTYLPLMGSADIGPVYLSYNDVTKRWAWFNSVDAIGAWEETAGGGLAIPGGAYVTSAPAWFDSDEDGWADFFNVGVRPLSTLAAGSDLYQGGFMANPTKIGGATFIFDAFVFEPYAVLYIPISVNLANGTSVAVYRWVTSSAFAADQSAGYWSFTGGYGQVDADVLGLGRKVVVFNWNGQLGQFAAVISQHYSGGGTGG